MIPNMTYIQHDKSNPGAAWNCVESFCEKRWKRCLWQYPCRFSWKVLQPFWLHGNGRPSEFQNQWIKVHWLSIGSGSNWRVIVWTALLPLFSLILFEILFFMTSFRNWTCTMKSQWINLLLRNLALHQRREVFGFTCRTENWEPSTVRESCQGNPFLESGILLGLGLFWWLPKSGRKKTAAPGLCKWQMTVNNRSKNTEKTLLATFIPGRLLWLHNGLIGLPVKLWPIMVKKSWKLNLASSVSKKPLDASQMQKQCCKSRSQLSKIQWPSTIPPNSGHAAEGHRLNKTETSNLHWTCWTWHTDPASQLHPGDRNDQWRGSGWSRMVRVYWVSGVAANLMGFTKWMFKLSTWSANGCKW